MRHLKYNILLLLSIAVASTAAYGQLPVSDENTEPFVYLARDDGEGKAGEAVSEFGINDVPIHCVVKLGSSESATIKMLLVAVMVNGVRPETKVVSASFTTNEGQNEVNFQGKPQKMWVAGIYRADIYLNGTMIKSIEFPIKGTLVTPVVNSFAPVKPKPKSNVTKKRP